MSVPLAVLPAGAAGNPTQLVSAINDRLRRISAALGATGPAGPAGPAGEGGFANPMTTLGDAIVGGASGAPERLGVGADGQVLTADSGAAYGVKWGTPATGAFGGVNVRTGDYTLLIGDSGFNVVLNSSSAGTFKLPSTPPNATWFAWIATIGAGELTVSPNGPGLDGGSSSVALCQFQGLLITTDGTNYFSNRGGPPAGTTITVPSGNGSALLLSATHSGYVGSLLSVVAYSGYGVYSSLQNSGLALGGAALYGSAVNDGALIATNSSGTIAAAAFSNTKSGGSGASVITVSGKGISTGVSLISFANTGSGPDIRLASYMSFGPGIAYASLPAGTAAFAVYCTDAKNFADDGVTVGSVASSGGHGALVAYVNGSWRTLC